MRFAMISIFAFFMTGMTNAAETGLKFAHSEHINVHRIECASCHNVVNSETLNDDKIPDHDVCSDCHTIEEAPKNCGYCHYDEDNPTGLMKPKTDRIFSHKGHLKGSESTEKCLSCHIDQDKLAAGKISSNCPVRDNCFVCHDGKKVSSECELCHTRPDEVITLVHDPGWDHEHK